MTKKKQVRVYQLYIAHELTYTSLDLNKLIGVAEHKARETLEEHGLPDNSWYTVESVVLDLVDSETDTIKLDWRITIDAKIRP